MRFSKSTLLVCIALVLALGNLLVFGKPSSPELEQLLPERLGAFRRSQSIELQEAPSTREFSAKTEYLDSNGEKFLLEIVRCHQDAEAYSLLTTTALAAREGAPSENIAIEAENGTAGFVASGQIVFFKGLHFVRVLTVNPRSNSRNLVTLARLLADRLDKGDGEIPVLVKHLPDWEHAQKSAVFLSRFSNLEVAPTFQSVLNEVKTEGDADAVIAGYGSARLLIVEFNTPQLASENDQRIIARIQDLWKKGEPAPSAYRRVGNYSVFVFDARSEQAAKELIDQVKYEQVVQWLGENPNILKEAERRYVATTLGVFLTVIKASGVAALGSLAIGGLFGALLFIRRRAQQRHVEAYSDAGGMLRLNIDELTPQTDPARLIRERN